MNEETFTPIEGAIPGATKDRQSITRDWQSLQPLIDGVRVREVLNVTKNNGVLTEIWRNDWALDDLPVMQAFQNLIHPGGISGWHVHAQTTDRIFVNSGLMKIVLYDARTKSLTYQMINEFRFGDPRPALLVIPPGVWHAVQNLASEPSRLINLVDRAYSYEDPDHWRLPLDSPSIPYRFQVVAPMKGDSRIDI